MRVSPLRHPLAILRKTIRLTQKEMADLVQRSARTIQAIELDQLPLSEELARLIAQATGIDAGWLLEKNPATPPRKGLTAAQLGKASGPYSLDDYEAHRALMESAASSFELMSNDLSPLQKMTAIMGKKVPPATPTMVTKRALLDRKWAAQIAQDHQTIEALDHLLTQTIATKSSDLIRWKIRRLLQTLADENSVTLNFSHPQQEFLTHVHRRAERPARRSGVKKS